MNENWTQRRREGLLIIEPAVRPPAVDCLAAFSGRGIAPEGIASPTEFLARRFAHALELDGPAIVRATQVHGCRAVTIRETPPEGTVTDAGECDILATNLPGVALAVQTADCVPIALAGKAAVAAAHAGWRGAAQDVAGAAVSALVALGEDPADLSAWLGPSIGPCCYEVGTEVARQFEPECVAAGNAADRFYLDLAAANRAQLIAAGVGAKSIQSYPICTRCGGQQYASYRRDGMRAGRMIGLVQRHS